jgi:predicted nucleic acid binding AN1-type Zn finger protein
MTCHMQLTITIIIVFSSGSRFDIKKIIAIPCKEYRELPLEENNVNSSSGTYDNLRSLVCEEKSSKNMQHLSLNITFVYVIRFCHRAFIRDKSIYRHHMLMPTIHTSQCIWQKRRIQENMDDVENLTCCLIKKQELY